MAKKKKSKAASVTVDFGHKEAKGGGGSVRVPEGDYLAEIVSASSKESESSGNSYIQWEFKILGPKAKGKKIKTNTVLVPKSFWVLRNLLEALGVEVPDKAVKVPYQKYVGEEIGLTIVDGDEYKNRIRSEVSDFIAPEQVGADEDEDDEDETDEDEESEDEDDDESEDDDEEEMDEVDLDEL